MIEENVLKKLHNDGYECFNNVSLGGKVAHLVAIKNNKITAFEFIKHALEISTAMGQCLHYLNDANKVCIVISPEEKDLISQPTIDTLKQHGIGLIISDHKIEILIEAKEIDKNNVSIVKEIKKKFIAKINHDEKNIKKYIVEVLKEHADGLTISDVAKLTGRNRLTISKYLAIMEAEKIIECREIGVSKIFKIKTDKNE
jgi:hypothetical protein